MTTIHNENTLRIGKAVPQGAVNLACYSIRKPDISENIQIAGMVEKSIKSYLTIPIGSENILSMNVTSKLILITDKIDDSLKEPLYYVYTLKYNIRSLTNDKKISIISDKGYISSNYKIKQELVEVDNNTYTVKLYTNFWADNVTSFYAIYNGIAADGSTVVGIKELINPQPYMTVTSGIPDNNTYNITPDADTYKVKTSGISAVYYVSILDGGNVTAKNCIEINTSWYPRIINGRIQKSNPDTKIPEKMTYTIPDYYKQTFSEYGAPYMKITEAGTIVGTNSVKVNNTPVYAPLDQNGIVTNVNVIVNSNSVTILSIDSNSGVITVGCIVNPNDNIAVTYYYMEDSFIYKGYIDDDTGDTVPLDINPSINHTYGYMDQNKKLILEPSFRLLNKTLYIYTKPSLIQVNSINSNDETAEVPKDVPYGTPIKIQLKYIARLNAAMNIRTKYSEIQISRKGNINTECTWDYPTDAKEATDCILLYNSNLLCGEPILIDYLKSDDNYQILKRVDTNTLFHTIEPLSISQEDELKAILIAKIYIRPNSSKDTVKLIDTRTRGGGLEEIDETLRLKMNPETQYYLDISSIYGEPIQKNGTIIIKLSKYILQQYGGNFTENDVENAVSKYIAFGVLPIIEYIEPMDHNVIE